VAAVKIEGKNIGVMEDLKLQFKGYAMPTAPSLLYERQNSSSVKKRAASPASPASPPPFTNPSNSKKVDYSIIIAAFIERSKSTSRLTPMATAAKRQ